MSDPLSLVVDPLLQAQLRRLRERVGTVLPAQSLRAELQGFKGLKGIYKPSGSPYALWVRQTSRGVYPDERPVEHPDGSWTYRYAPEGRGGRSVMGLDTNQSLLRCQTDGVPVGVLVEKEGLTGGKAYEIRGLAFVERFDGTHFILRGEPIDWDVKPFAEGVPHPFEPFDRIPPKRMELIRKVREPRFSWAVGQAYHEKCSLCELGYRIRGEPVGLQAAHVIPFKDGGTTRDVRNGILLCSNHHSLFDGWGWTLDEEYRVVIADDKDFRATALPNHVLALEGRKLPNLPDSAELCPDPRAIGFRLDRFTAFWK